ncbi:phage tail protein [Rhodococcus erythropolis]|uniref:Gp37-like protein n=1 Tax=Rhodococcus erythropolis TaxID=1833 RepID=UPI0024BB51ED|nr:phage tail protein [Rhodococcus erythropolis]MDJ0404040.1 phage tail protein [Rhodococcus erythropolis]
MSVLEEIDQDLLDRCNAIWAATQAQEKQDTLSRLEPPLMRLWDGDYNMHHIVGCEYSANFEWINNDSGTGLTELPFDSAAAQWIYDVKGRIARGEKRNVHISIDKNGARWSGRMQDFSVEKRDDGTVVMVVRWIHDYETLKHYQVWCNPFTAAAVQWPRVFMLAGPGIWALKCSLFLQIMRENTSLWRIPDDPLNLNSWGSGLDMSNWSVVVKPTSFMQDLAAGSLWTVVSSRFKTWHDMAKRPLADGEYTVVVRRWFTGDELPWPGANLRHGALVVDIVDKSGYYTGTATSGSMFTGLKRTVAHFAENFIDSTLDLVNDNSIPADYLKAGVKSTDKAMPYVVFREGEETGIQTSTFLYTPSTATQINVGGHSAPGVDETISASIQAVGDILGNLAQIGSLGGSIDTLAKPFYQGTLFAWMSLPSKERKDNSGWASYFEYFQDGADRAYTLSSLMVLRAGFWSTRTWFSHELVVADGAPWLIGDQGQGHLWLGDRCGSTVTGDITGEVYVSRVHKIGLAWDRETAPDWMPTIGDDSAKTDPVQHAHELLEDVKASLMDAGVY